MARSAFQYFGRYYEIMELSGKRSGPASVARIPSMVLSPRYATLCGYPRGADSGGNRLVVMPPSTTRTCPVTNEEAAEARKTIGPLNSSGSAQRLSGVRLVIMRLKALSAARLSFMGVSKKPGAMAL